MRVKDLNDSETVWSVSSAKWAIKSEVACRSKLQYEVGQLIQAKYPFDRICEDITIPNSRLSLDFFLPQRRLVIEVQGQQHNKRNSFFHNSNLDFIKQQSRDNDKKLFCDINHFILICVDSTEEAKDYLNDR